MQNFYKVISSEDGLVNSFTTRFNVKYTLTLTSYQLGEFRVFSLSLYPDKEINKFDYWVKNTVISIIKHFLESDSNVVFYVCDIEDERQDQRNRVFEYWYIKEKELPKFIVKYNYNYQSKHGYVLYTSLLYNIGNPLAGLIIQELKNQMNIY